MTELKAGLPPLPQRMKGLPIDERGFPVPWFVAEIDGKWDFRVIRPGGLQSAHRKGTCWLCGQELGPFKTFVLGCMCAVNRINSEPPSHYQCARYAAIACPFLTKPAMRRNEKDMPAEAQDPAGTFIKRNPGVTCLWMTESYEIFPADGGSGFLFSLGDPNRVEWWREGRAATLAEVNASIASGMPLLLDAAEEQGPEAVHALHQAVKDVVKLLPVAA